jgi:4-amino-4-deoxy-L-arabinose transferase-like glycosyltransferase
LAKKIIENKNLYFFFGALFCLNFSYAFLLCQIDQTYSAFLTLPFLILLFIFFLLGTQFFLKLDPAYKPLHCILISGLLIHLGLISGVFCTSLNIPIFWVPDSNSIHVPGSLNLLDYMNGSDLREKTSLYDRTYLTHILVAIFFKIFGINHFASSLALIVPKLITIILIYKVSIKIDNEKTALLASLIYCFLPTQIFYSLVFYKEAVVQMLVAVLIYNLFLLNQKLSWKLFPTVISFILVLLALGNERHYLIPCYVVAMLVLTLLSTRISIIARIFVLFACYACYKFFLHFYTDIHYRTIVATVLAYRDVFLSYPDVTPINKWLPYPFTVIKLFFSPYFTFDKLKNYQYFAGLITFGSFFYQILAFSLLAGIYQKFKQKQQIRMLIVQLIPFLIFLGIFGYVAPYDGRARDSFLPLIAIYSSSVILNSTFFNKLINYLPILKKQKAIS